MSPSDSLHLYINQFAPLLVAIGILCVAAEYVGWKIPWGAIAKFFGWVFGLAFLLSAIGVALMLLQRLSAAQILAAWFALSLPVYLLWRYHTGAEARAEWQARLRQARHHERRRASPPLPGGTHGGTRHPTHGPTAPRSRP